VRAPGTGAGPAGGGTARQVAYLINQYPLPSHSFIRREILALEAAGWCVHRFSHRSNPVALVEPANQIERDRTFVLLNAGAWAMWRDVVSALIRRPVAMIRSTGLALRMARLGDRRFIAHVGYLVMACTLSRRLRALGCVHVHAHFGTNPAALVCLAHHLAGLSYSATFHGPHEFDPALRLNLGEKISAARFIAVVSRDGMQRLARQYPGQAAKFRHIPCVLDGWWFDQPRRDGVPGAELVCVARLDAQKNPMLLLEAAELLARRGVVFRLRIAGDGDLRQDLQARVDGLGLGTRVLLLGWQTQAQVADLLRGARALVLSSADEGLPVAIMEAFALGVPAIAPAVGAVAELVQTGATGWLVRRDDAVALADAMQQCLSASAEELQRLGLAARRQVRPHDVRVSAQMLAAGFAGALVAPRSP